MSLKIEDGSLVDGANSYATIEEVRAYATARASSIPEDDGSLEVALIQAMDYLEGLHDDYQGLKVDPLVQELQWPRVGVTLDGVDLPSTSIPKALKNAQCQLAIEAAAGLDLMPTGDGRAVVREKLDVMETEYAVGTSSAPQPELTKVRAILSPLLRITFGGLRVTRV